MELTARGRNLALTDAIRHYVDRKVLRLARYWPSLGRVDVTCRVDPTRDADRRHRVEVRAVVGGMRFYAAEAAPDLYAAIDGVSEKLERQVLRKKRFLRDRRVHLPRRRRVRRFPSQVPPRPADDSAD